MRGPLRSSPSGAGRDGLLWRLVVTALGVLGLFVVPGAGPVPTAGPAFSSATVWTPDSVVRPAAHGRAVTVAHRQGGHACQRTDTAQAVARDGGKPFTMSAPLFAVLPSVVFPVPAPRAAERTAAHSEHPPAGRRAAARCRAPPAFTRT